MAITKTWPVEASFFAMAVEQKCNLIAINQTDPGIVQGYALSPRKIFCLSVLE
jgi:hypothetical protein